MKTRRFFGLPRTLALVLGMAGLLMLTMTPSKVFAQKDGNKFGVGIVPHMNAGDKIEKALHEIVGEMPEVDHLYNVNDSEHLLRTLLNLKKTGRQINYLVIAGHGSRDTPGIKFAKDDMIPEEVDLQWNKQQLAIAQSLRQNPGKAGLGPGQLDQRIRELSTRIRDLESVSDVMAKDAVVLLINCSAAATEKGQKFVRSFGEVLLGKRGGSIIASRQDISLHQRKSHLQRLWTRILEGRWVESGEYLVKGDWVSFPISAIGIKSGTYPLVFRHRGRTHTVTWKLVVNGNQITGTMIADCCPGPRVDPLRGSISGDRVIINRDCSGQGWKGPCHQVYDGALSTGSNVIRGSFSGTGSAPDIVWTVDLSSRTN